MLPESQSLFRKDSYNIQLDIVAKKFGLAKQE